MALGSWMGIYISVSDDLMAQRREQELMLLMAIARHADRLGFCYPGRARLMEIRHVSQPVYERRLAFLEEHHHVRVLEGYDWRRRQKQFDFQVSPRVLYVREEFQLYCEQVFDGVEERNLALEKWLLENHFSTNDSQPETEPDALPDSVTRRSEADAVTRLNNQRGNARIQTGRNASTMRNGAQPAAAPQPTANSREAHRENNPQAGGADEFDQLIEVDDGRLIDEMKHAVATTKHQAKMIVATYPREGIIHWMRITAQRRAKGELSKPGGWFYKMLQMHVEPIETPGPNGQFETWD